MDISIIIGLLIALVIICATTVVNNIISKDYLSLKKKWDDRDRVLCDVAYYIGKIQEHTDELMNGNLYDNTKQRLLLYKDTLNVLFGRIKCYEKEAL